MPKLIDYPRTSYTGAWELAEIVDDTGGKCAIDTAARKLNRKVSGSFKAIIGSGVKFGLLTSKRDLLTTTTLFKRIKHAYDKQEEIVFHREAFLTPPLFTQLCRKFRGRELPVQMLDVILIREFAVEEINAQGVAKAFVDGCRMVGLLNEHNIIADIDALAAQQSGRRELASRQPTANTFRQDSPVQTLPEEPLEKGNQLFSQEEPTQQAKYHQEQVTGFKAANIPQSAPHNTDAIASLFGFASLPNGATALISEPNKVNPVPESDSAHLLVEEQATESDRTVPLREVLPAPPYVTEHVSNATNSLTYQIQISGPGMNTLLSITEEEDIALAVALLEKIRRQLRA
jgi:hypothetical protein